MKKQYVPPQYVLKEEADRRCIVWGTIGIALGLFGAVVPMGMAHKAAEKAWEEERVALIAEVARADYNQGQTAEELTRCYEHGASVHGHE